MSRFGRFLLAMLPVLTLGTADCYSQGDGTPPPLDRFYFPVGLRVSAGGNVLYAVNSDFDLQYNGGTFQSYDLRLIRQHVVEIIKDPSASTRPDIPLVVRTPLSPGQAPPCPGAPPVTRPGGSEERQPLGETCAPAVDSRFYFRDVGVIGAFATDLLLSPPPERLPPAGPVPGARRFDRLFSPVRGNASLTWASVERDEADVPPLGPDYAPWRIDCGQDGKRRCNARHQAGTNPDDNTRKITMPGEPFGIAMSEDGQSLVITHQNDPKTSLFSTGLYKGQPGGVADDAPAPVLDFILDGMPLGGVGAVAVPHDDDAFAPGQKPLPAFLQTMRIAAEIDLLRRYPDAVGSVTAPGGAPSAVGQGSSLRRPFLDREAIFPITASAGGFDSRGIAVDPTPRLACKARVPAADAATGRTEADVQADRAACARKPARVFIANRSPAAILVGEVGGTPGNGGAWDPDRVTIHSSIPLSAGPSRLYVAPIVDRDGHYAVRVFAVCFDSAALFVYDPDSQAVESIFRVAPGPFAMAFDPFDLDAVARHEEVKPSPVDGIRRYRFAYLASFTESFVQIIDLDNTAASPTFERIVFTLGRPTQPKGS